MGVQAHIAVGLDRAQRPEPHVPSALAHGSVAVGDEKGDRMASGQVGTDEAPAARAEPVRAGHLDGARFAADLAQRHGPVVAGETES